MRVVEEFALRGIRLLLGIVLLASVLLICSNAFGRYVLAKPIIWAEEILGFALVWTVYLGAVQVTSENGHLRMDLLTRSLPPGLARGLEFAGHMVFLAIAVLIVYQAYFSIAQFTHHSQIASLPMDVVHSVIPISFVLMGALSVLRGFARLFRADDSDAGGTARP